MRTQPRHLVQTGISEPKIFEIGHDVIAIGNHRLNTKSLHTTAIDLSEVFDVTVRYGYVDDWIDPDTGKEGSFEFVELGRMERNELLFTLVDTMYTDRLHTGNYLDDIDYAFYGTEDKRVDITIFRDFFDSRIHFDSRWRSFVNFFQGKPGLTKGYINEFRLSVWSEVKQLGGNLALYGDDQGESRYMIDEASELYFEDLLQRTKEFGKASLNVSSFMCNYANGKFEQIEYKAFIDDFEDLK